MLIGFFLSVIYKAFSKKSLTQNWSPERIKKIEITAITMRQNNLDLKHSIKFFIID